MEDANWKITNDKVIIRIHNRVCENPDELVNSELFRQIVNLSIDSLIERKSVLLRMFEAENIGKKQKILLCETLKYAHKMPLEMVAKVVEGADCFLRKKNTFFNYIEFLYNYWRSYDRFVLCDSAGDALDQRPYRTFNDTVEELTHLVRRTYRDIQENITGEHPNVYRQVRAGAGFASIAIKQKIDMPVSNAEKLRDIGIIRQILLNPPLVLDPPMNKRKGKFVRVDVNPLDKVQLKPEEWICYPVKAGPLVILAYINEKFYELGLSMANLFEIATDEDLQRQPDGVYLFGVERDQISGLGEFDTVFYDDEEHQITVAACPNDDEFGYFGYLKKMILTQHNIRMMKTGRLPFHGSLTIIRTKDGGKLSILLIGDSGAGKSETLEAFRQLGQEILSDLTVIADDMGSLDIDDEGIVRGYGTEVGAFLRLDDLSPGMAFGSIDRAIFMSAAKTNARIIIPVTELYHVLKGVKLDFVLYANNYEVIDEDHPLLDRFESPEEALSVFREGAVMSKGTTASTGIVHSYFANIFGPPEYRNLHDKLAEKYFAQLFENDTFVGQIRTQLGVPGYERSGPMRAAKALIRQIGK